MDIYCRLLRRLSCGALWCLIKNGYIESRKSLVLGQEICFGTVAWDYSHLPLNINGRVCLLYSLFWGVLGVVWVKAVILLMRKIFDRVHLPFEKVIVWAFIAFFVFDCALSASAALRMNERAQGIAASNKVEQFLDTYYPDDKMNQIYANSRPAE